jgi:hypothetical protein
MTLLGTRFLIKLSRKQEFDFQIAPHPPILSSPATPLVLIVEAPPFGPSLSTRVILRVPRREKVRERLRFLHKHNKQHMEVYDGGDGRWKPSDLDWNLRVARILDA